MAFLNSGILACIIAILSLSCLNNQASEVQRIPSSANEDVVQNSGPTPQGSVIMDGFEMVLIPGGKMNIGCDAKNSSMCLPSASPAHEIAVDDFYLMRCELTREQWKKWSGKLPVAYEADCDHCAVDYLSWNDVQAFIASLNKQTGKKFRLPTEAEWEYAARGGQSSRGYAFAGSNTIQEVAWIFDKNTTPAVHPVGEKKANELGLFDMSGNVFEWCEDIYMPYGKTQTTPADESSKQETRVIRGGSCDMYDFHATCWYREGNLPIAENADDFFAVGFRLALSAGE